MRGLKINSHVPTRQMIVYAISFLGLFIIPVVWYSFHFIFWEIQPVAQAIAEDLGTNTTMYYQIDTFFQGIDNWFAVIALVALALFGFVYSHKRGTPVD